MDDAAARAEIDRLRAQARDPIRIKFQAETDTLKAQVQIAELQRKMSGLDGNIQVGGSTTEATNKIRALQARLRMLDTTVHINGDTGDLTRAIDRARAELALLQATSTTVGQKSGASMHLLLDAILLLAPAIIPIAGAATALAGGLVGAGAVGVIAMTSIVAEMKKGSKGAQDYVGAITSVKNTYKGLQTTVAEALKPGFLAATDKLTSQMPMLRQQFIGLSTVTGDILSHLVGGLIGGFRTFEPMMLHTLGYVDKLAARFETWASGPGGAHFAASITTSFDRVMPVLGQLTTFLTRFIAALNGYGLGIISVLGKVAGVLNALPMGVFTAIVTGLAAWRIAALATAGANALLAASNAAVAASAIGPEMGGLGAGLAGAGAGAGRLAGTGAMIAGVTSKLIPYALAWAAAGVAASAASNATDKWAMSSNSAARWVHELAKSAADIFTFHWDKLNSDTSTPEKAYAKYAKTLKEVQGVESKIVSQSAAFKRAMQGGGATLPGVRGQNAPTMGPDAAAFNTERARAYSDVVSGITLKLGVMQQTLNGTPVSGGGDVFSRTQTSIQKTVDSVDALTKIGGKTVTTIDGIKISEGAWDAAMKKTGQSGSELRGTIQGWIEGMIHGRVEINGLIVDQQRLSTYQSESMTKFSLTAEQVDVYSAALGLTIPIITKFGVSVGMAETFLGSAAKTLSNGNESIQAWTVAAAAAEKGANTLTTRADLLAAGLTALRGVTLTMASANLGAVSATEALATALDTNKASVGRNGELLGQLVKTSHGYVVMQPQLTAGSVAISSAMQAAATSAVDLAKSIYANTNNADDAFAAFTGLRAQFVSTEIQAGRTAAEAEGLAKQIYGIPTDAQTFVKLLGKDDVAGAITALTTQLVNFGQMITEALLRVNPGNSEETIRNILTWMSYLQDKTVTVNTVNKTSTENSQLPVGVKNTHGARGGALAGHGGGDIVHALLEPGEHVLTVSDVDKLGGQAAVYRMRRKAQAGLLKFASGGWVPPSLLLKPTSSASGSSSGSASSASSASSSVTAAAKTAASAAAKHLRDLIALGKSIQPEIARLASLATASQATVTSAMAAIVASVHTAMTYHVAPSKLVNAITLENRDLVHLTAQRITLTTRLSAANAALAADKAAMAQLQSQVASTVMGGFNIGTSGQGYSGGIASSLHQQTVDATKFNSLLGKAKALGLDPAMLEQLSSQGPQAAGKNLESIVKAGTASKGYISGLNTDYAALTHQANLTGQFDAQLTYAKQVAHDTAEQVKQQRALNATNKAIANDIHAVRAQLDTLERSLVAAQRRAGG